VAESSASSLYGQRLRMQAVKPSRPTTPRLCYVLAFIPFTEFHPIS
jgi:hypothetical protein